jgi:hypothetical protein
MNAKMLSKIGIGFTLTALGLSGGLSFTGACGGGSDNNGGGGGGAGGGGGGTGGGGSSGCVTDIPEGSSCEPGENDVCFSKGQAKGLMTGWSYIALGSVDVATSPVCDNTANGGTCSEKITKEKPCPEQGGKTMWNNPDKGLCLSGSIPVVTGGDYTGNWGVQIGWNASDPAGTPIGKTFSKINFTWTGTVDPLNPAMRGELHRQGDSAETTYCATVRSGEDISLSAFNTKCWDKTGVDLTTDDVAKIDKMGLQVSADDKKAYTITDLCVTKVTFTP